MYTVSCAGVEKWDVFVGFTGEISDFPSLEAGDDVELWLFAEIVAEDETAEDRTGGSDERAVWADEIEDVKTSIDEFDSLDEELAEARGLKENFPQRVSFLCLQTEINLAVSVKAALMPNLRNVL